MISKTMNVLKLIVLAAWSSWTIPESFAEQVELNSASFVGLKECAACHSAPSPIYQRLAVTEFVRLVESTEWLQRDKHAVAYDLIKIDGLSPEELKLPNRVSNLRTLTMLQNLQWKVEHNLQTNKWTVKDERFAQQCLTCHVGADHRKPLPDKSVLQFGVQCESCHGPGSEYIQTQNHQQTSWRAKTPEEKARFGMREIRSPSEAARICYSCHMGDLSQNRFVTHQFYAAGHPPLPPVELQTFLDAMPPHWRTLQEKPYPASLNESSIARNIQLKPNPEEEFERQREYYQANFGTKSDDEYQSLKVQVQNDFPRSRRVMIGSLVANSIGLETIHQLADDSQGQLADEYQNWGDYAIYDCMGCHQELRKPSTRIVSMGRVPGRAYPSQWWISNTLETLSETKETGSLTQSILETFDRVPLGDRKKVVSITKDQNARLRQRENEMKVFEREPLSAEDVKSWLALMIRERQSILYDYWTAKQTSWMVKIALEELVSHNVIQEVDVREDINKLTQLFNLNLQTESQQSSVLTGLKTNLSMAIKFRARDCDAIFQSILKKIDSKSPTSQVLP